AHALHGRVARLPRPAARARARRDHGARQHQRHAGDWHRLHTRRRPAHALGQRDRWVLARHIMPNCVSALLVQASVNFANAMVIEAGLSFLGIGTPPPTPSWRLMLNEARAFMTSAKHVAIAPGVAISLAVLGWNLLGDGLRDALDPRLTD